MNYIKGWPGLLRYIYQIEAKIKKKRKENEVHMYWIGSQEKLK
jgi:hypothetical protein